jgi:Na+-transporting methylmalonyl-CoA/oxaloacetate decarboxylase beta subunit
MHGILLFLSGSCLKTEVFKQLYYMMNEKRKIILLIIVDIAFIVSTLFSYNFLIKNNANEALSVAIIGGDDGPTTIYIFPQIKWKIILVYSLSFAMGGLIILSIINIVEYVNTKKLSLKYKITIILLINLLLTILLFSSMIWLSILMDIVIIIVFIIVKTMKKVSYKK